MERWKNIFSDPEFWFILVFNAFLAWAYTGELISKDTTVWIYFFQSVIIGMSNAIRIAGLSNFLASNLSKDGQPVAVTTKTKWSGAIFFTFHYGFFHILIFIALVIFSFDNGSKLDLKIVMIHAGIMAINAIISTYSTIVQDREEKPAINDLFFTPYMRIIPMHFFLIIGITRKANPEVLLPLVGAINVFWLFLILKLLADLIMHIIIQKTWRKPRVKPLGGYI
jgi:hypothetical protein